MAAPHDKTGTETPTLPPVTVHLTAAVLRACAAIVETARRSPTCYTLANKLWAAAEEIDQQTPQQSADDDGNPGGRPQ